MDIREYRKVLEVKIEDPCGVHSTEHEGQYRLLSWYLWDGGTDGRITLPIFHRFQRDLQRFIRNMPTTTP
jgi:hypothetical protein